MLEEAIRRGIVVPVPIGVGLPKSKLAGLAGLADLRSAEKNTWSSDTRIPRKRSPFNCLRRARLRRGYQYLSVRVQPVVFH